MPQKSFDDAAVRAAMRGYLDLAEALDEASRVGGEPRQLLELAEAKAMAGLELRKRLVELGWVAPSAQRSST